MTTRRSTRARSALSMLAVFGVVGAFTFRLVDIQLVQAAELNAESSENRSLPETLYGTRGQIVDRTGAVLASNVARYDVTIAPNVVAKDGMLSEELRASLGEIGGLTGTTGEALAALVLADPEAKHAYLVKGVDTDTYRAIRELDVPGVYFEYNPGRVYPNGAIAGNLVGKMGTDAPRYGVELSEDSCLASEDGAATYERSEDGVRLPGSRVVAKEPTDGSTVQLTIDHDLQWFAQQALGEQALATGSDWGTATVVEIETGKIRALADWPVADPNDLDNAPKTPEGELVTGSRAFAVPYEPGSTFKAMSMAMLLDAGVATPTTQVIAPGRFTTPTGESLRDAWAHDDLRYTLAGVLVNSSNTGVSTLITRLDMQTRYDYLRKFGIGEPTAVEFPGESAGLFRTPDQWDGLSRYNIMFGQGVAATSAQVASVYQALGNDGTRLPLTLVEGCLHADGTMTDTPTAEPVQTVSPSAARQTIEILENTVTQGGLRTSVQIPGYRVAAKTGTAEVARSDGSGYGSDRIVSVAGVAPAEDPKYAVVVTLGLPDTIKTAQAAAPTFSKIMSQTLTTFRVPPSTEPAPTIPLTW